MRKGRDGISGRSLFASFAKPLRPSR